METTEKFEALTNQYINEKDLYKIFEQQHLVNDINSKSIKQIESEIDGFTKFMSFFSNIKQEMLKEKVISHLDGNSQHRLDAVSGLIDIQNVYLVQLGARLSYKYNWLNIRIAIGSLLIGLALSFMPFLIPDSVEDKAMARTPTKIDLLTKKNIELEKIVSHQDSLIKIIVKNTTPKPRITTNVLIPKRPKVQSKVDPKKLFL